MKSPPYKRCLTVLMLMVALMLLVTSGTGCRTENIEQYRAANAELKAALVETQAQLADAQDLLAEIDEDIAAAPDGPVRDAAVNAREKIADVIERGTVFANQLSDGITQTEAAIEAAIAGDAAGAVNILGPYVASKVPPPWSVYILSGSTLLGAVLTYLQKRKTVVAQGEKTEFQNQATYLQDQVQRQDQETISLRRAAASVITAIEYEKDDQGSVDFADDATQASLRSRMSTEARDLVEQVRRAQPARLKAVTIKPAT